MNKLEDIIFVHNMVAAYMNQVGPSIVDFYSSYIGKKIVKSDNSLLKSVKDKLQIKPSEDRIDFFQDKNSVFFNYVFNGCKTFNGIAAYQTISLNVGSLSGDVLESVNPYIPFPIYSLEEVQRKIKQVSNIEKEINALRNQQDEIKNRDLAFIPSMYIR